jgi:hypothetical protein
VAEVDSGLEQLFEFCLWHLWFSLSWCSSPALLAGDLVVARQDPVRLERGLV